MITLPNWFNQSAAQAVASLFRDGWLISTANIILAIVAFSFTVMVGAKAQEDSCVNQVLQAKAMGRAGGVDGCSLLKSVGSPCPCDPGTESAALAARADAAARQMFESCVAEHKIEGNSEAQAETACGGSTK